MQVGEEGPNRFGALLLLGTVALLVLVMAPSAASMAGSTITTKDWSVSLSWTNPNQPPGSATTISMNIAVTQTVYNLQIMVSGQDLSISSGSGSGNSYSWDQLNQGDTRQIQFVVTTPSAAPVGNKYNVTVAAQSYATPAGLFGARAPWDSPNDKASTSFLLQVTPLPVLPQSPGIDWGSVAVGGLIIIVVAIGLLYLWSRQYG
ncbi:MAG: hypothetical protein KGI38_05770 [Thaumarchaeota archaeon]|nr:hypothetical protein [Nitrososphaerota archaeon]